MTDRSSRNRDESSDRGRRETSRDRNPDADRHERGDSRDSGRDRGGRDEGRDMGRRETRGGNAFSYQKRTAEQVNKRSSMGAKDFDSYIRDDIQMWKPNDGPNTIRILPPTWPNPEHYGVDVWVHFGIGPDAQSYLCTQKMKDEPCAICEERDLARRRDEDEKYIKDLEPKRRVLFYLIDRDSEKDGVQAWAAPWTIDQDITKISVDRRTNEVLPVDDPEEGYDVEFDKEGKGITTKYKAPAIARRESALGNRKWLDFAVENPLPSILEFYSYEHIQKVFGGGGSHSTRSDRDSRDSGRDRDRDDSRDTRSRDRDNDRGSRDKDRGHDDDRDTRGRDRDRDEAPRRDAAHSEPEFTWESIHAMKGAELDDLIEVEKLTSIDPNKADSDDQLADWICEEMRIVKEEPRTSRRETSRDSKDEGDHRDKLRNLRERR